MITYDQTVNEVREIIARKGEDYIYERVPGVSDSEGTQCAYFYNYKPSCLIGHWLSKHGVDSAGLFEGDEARTVVPALGVEADLKAINFLQALQEEQDFGHPWGLALEKAIALTKNRIES